MKKLKFILIFLLAIPVYVAAQTEETDFDDLYSATERNDADQLFLKQGDSTVRMTTQLLLQDVNAAISDNAADIATNGVNISSNAVAIVSNTSNIAANTAHAASTSNPHSVTSTQVLPSQSGKEDYVLKTNGTSAYWGEESGGGSSSTVVSYTTCTHSATTNITIGTTSDVSFKLEYVAERNTGAAVQKQFGEIDVGYDDVSGAVYYYSDYIGASLDFDIEADVSAGVIRLNIIVGSSTSNDLSFDETIIHKFYE